MGNSDGQVSIVSTFANLYTIQNPMIYGISAISRTKTQCLMLAFGVKPLMLLTLSLHRNAISTKQ